MRHQTPRLGAFLHFLLDRLAQPCDGRTVLIETTPIVACCDFAELPQTDTKPLTEIQPSAVVQVDVVLPANDPAEEINDF
jgi:hypothetical protein